MLGMQGRRKSQRHFNWFGIHQRTPDSSKHQEDNEVLFMPYALHGYAASEFFLMGTNKKALASSSPASF